MVNFADGPKANTRNSQPLAQGKVSGLAGGVLPGESDRQFSLADAQRVAQPPPQHDSNPTIDQLMAMRPGRNPDRAESLAAATLRGQAGVVSDMARLRFSRSIESSN